MKYYRIYGFCSIDYTRPFNSKEELDKYREVHPDDKFEVYSEASFTKG